jgi:4-hydroxybenzoate polyprenyltransferase
MQRASSKGLVSRRKPAEASRETINAVDHRAPNAVRMAQLGKNWRAFSRATARAATAFQTLHIYGAVGIASFGSGLCRLLGFDAVEFVPLWFAGGLFAYNLDRLWLDPADAINTPNRVRRSGLLRCASRALAAVAIGTLVLLPILRGQLILALAVALGTLVATWYSVPILGLRLKEIPVLKTLIPPGAVTAACLAPVFIGHSSSLGLSLALAAAWALCFLTFNMLLCDLRDQAGDAAHGIKSIPVLAGPAVSSAALVGLLTASVLLALLLGWTLLAILAAVYLTALLIASSKPRGEAFYEWAVEGMLFLPAIALLAERFA